MTSSLQISSHSQGRSYDGVHSRAVSKSLGYGVGDPVACWIRGCGCTADVAFGCSATTDRNKPPSGIC